MPVTVIEGFTNKENAENAAHWITHYGHKTYAVAVRNKRFWEVHIRQRATA